MVIVTGQVPGAQTSRSAFFNYDVSGATTVAPNDLNAFIFITGAHSGSGSESGAQASAVSFVTVNAGSNIFTMDVKEIGGSTNITNRTITVIPLG